MGGERKDRKAIKKEEGGMDEGDEWIEGKREEIMLS